MSTRYRLGDLQLAIMRVLWERGEAAVAEVHAALEDERGLAPTTIATMLTKMEDKGVVAHRSEGRRFVYRPTVSEEAVQREMLAELTKDFDKKKYYFALTVASGERFAGLQSGELYLEFRRYDKTLALVEPNLAARSTGLGFLQTLIYVILPQAVRLAIPPLTNRTIAITKGTALGQVVAVQEILYQAYSGLSFSYNPSPLTLGALAYLALFLPIVIVGRWIETRFAWRR